MNINKITKSKPFSTNLVIDKLENALSLNGRKILLIAFENDYLFYGIKIKQLLEAKNSVRSVSLDSFVFKSDVFDSLINGIEEIVCVGNIEIINLLRYFLPNRIIYFVPTSLVFYGAFSTKCRIIKNGIVLEKTAEIPKVIVDIDIFPKLKLRHIADSFCSVATASFWKIDYKLYLQINGGMPNKEALTAMDEANMVLSKINSRNCYEILLTCQIYLAFAVYLESELDSLTDLYVAIIFNRLSNSSFEECRFFAIEYLLKLYSVTLKTEIENNLIYPDYLTNILRLTELFDADKSEYLDKYKVIKDSSSAKAFKQIRNNGMNSEIESLIKTLPVYKNAYKNLYKARKARANFDICDSLKALSLAGVTSKGYLKLLFDSGVLQQVENI